MFHNYVLGPSQPSKISLFFKSPADSTLDWVNEPTVSNSSSLKRGEDATDVLKESQKDPKFRLQQWPRTANRTKHDLEIALLAGTSSCPALGKIRRVSVIRRLSTGDYRQCHDNTSTNLPIISSLLDRSFPLPGPQQIEAYAKEIDDVHLNPRPLIEPHFSTIGDESWQLSIIGRRWI